MALLSNGSTVKLTSPGSGNQHSNNQNNQNDIFFSNLLNNLPRWDGATTSVPVTVPSRYLIIKPSITNLDRRKATR